MRKYLCICLVIVLAIVTAGCGSSSKGETASTVKGLSKSYPELRWGFTSFPAALDTTKVPFLQTFSIEALVVTNLMEVGPGGSVRPGVASSTEQPNPTTYVYHLRSMKFSDGKPVTAADVVFSLERNITGKESWTKSYWEDASSISAPNNSTVVIKLKHPNAIFQDVVAFNSQVIEKSSAEKFGEKALGTPGHMPIGAGPWKIDSYQPEASVHLSRNPYWTGPRQPAEKITITLFKTEAAMALALRSGALDGVFDYLAPKIFTNLPGVRSWKAPGTTIGFVSANTEMPPFNNVHVRRALAYATDTEGMIDALYPGGLATEAPTIMPASLFDGLGSKSEVDKVVSSLPTYKFDLAKAKQELAKSPYPHGFSTTIATEQENANQVSSAQILSSDLAKIGITAHVEEVTPADVPTLLNGKTKLVIAENLSVYPDPEGIMSTMIALGQIHPPGSGQNQANFRNAQVDKLLAESIETLDKPKRLQMIGKLLKIMNEEAPYWPLYAHATFASLSEKYVFSSPFNGFTLVLSPWALNVKLAS
ncbi:MAG: ABC transporter substrate-binding protein [Solirubrobacteraceae bacterium]